MLQVTNDRTHRLEAFEPQNAPRVTMYVCGPTVYDYSHLGHAKCYVSWDVVRRHLKYKGYDLVEAMNFTDIDDKIINRARETGEDWQAVAERFVHEFFVDMDALGNERVELYPRATEHIPEMIAHIEGLIAKGFAYASGGDVYYAVTHFETYGQLSGRTLDQMQAGARVEIDEKKRHPMDFALWKASKPGEPSWDSPWGPGRPGWHIECSAMVRKHLGDTIDIHTGGTDLLFPHHENEVAQSEALTEQTFARFWLHNGFVAVGGEKMSKSLGNFTTIRELLKRYDAQTIRYFLLSMHYRQETDFADDAIQGAGTGLNRLRKGLGRYAESLAAPTPEVQALAAKAEERFTAAMDDDFNTPRAIAVFFETQKALGELVEKDPAAEASAGHVVAKLFALAQVLGLDLAHQPEAKRDLSDVAAELKALYEELAPAEVLRVTAGTLDAEELLNKLIVMRQEAKKAKNFGLSDQIRDRLKEAGIQLMDKPGGLTEWELLEAASRPTARA
ncbi:Cysteine--tRNA ligase [compost metagenome]